MLLKAISAALSAVTSVVGLTVVMLFALDLLLRMVNPADAMGFNSVDLWGVPPRMQIARRSAPDVVVLGSSLLLVLSEANPRRQYSSIHFPPYLQTRFRSATGRDVTCVNLCSGLQMVSETFMNAQAAIDQKDYPRVIVYGTTLRDFMDPDFTREWNCTSFASTAPYVPVSPAVLGTLTSDQARLAFILCHYWYLYRDHGDFKTIMTALAKEALENLPLDQPYYRLGSRNYQWAPQRDGFLWERWVPRNVEKLIESMYHTHPELVKKLELERQAGVYKRGSEVTRLMGAHYFEALMAMCRQKGIKLVVVNMPLGPETTAMVPPGLNSAFRGYLQEATTQYGIALIDLFQDPEFGGSDFKDSVHLNSLGARKLVDRIVSDLAAHHPDVLATMAAHADARAANPKLKAEREAPYSQVP